LSEARRPPAPSLSLPPTLDTEQWQQAASMAELGVLSASLLHELRQPLFAIKAHAQLGRVDRGAGGGERYDRILEQVKHIEDLIRYYGSFGRTDEPETVYDLNSVIRAAADMLSHRARKAGVTVELVLHPAALPIRGRELAARQVSINLVQNAMDAVEGRNVRRVTVRTDLHGDRVRMQVTDTGPGVPAHLRDKMFDAFVTTKPPDRGTGLGLYIAKKMVTEARGVLRVGDAPGGGACFEVDLPVAM
jgi:two-component system C4-dicarboxylate transport sensor histidine kinase DctB